MIGRANRKILAIGERSAVEPVCRRRFLKNLGLSLPIMLPGGHSLDENGYRDGQELPVDGSG